MSRIVKTDAKLKPCPFCGGKGVLVWIDHKYYVTCDTCTCRTASHDIGVRYYKDAIAEAVDAWNTRVTPKYSEDTPNFAYGNDAVYWHDEYEKLVKAVEVIRDATERTCEVLGEDYDELLEYWETELSCGHVFDGMAEYVNYCPECGAKVVHKTEKVWCDYDKETPVYTNGKAPNSGAKVVEE